MLYLELARRQKKWTQLALSRVTRIHQGFLSMIELGKGIPDPDQLQRLATALDLPVDLVLKTVPTVEVPKNLPPAIPEEVIEWPQDDAPAVVVR